MLWNLPKYVWTRSRWKDGWEIRVGKRWLQISYWNLRSLLLIVAGEVQGLRSEPVSPSLTHWFTPSPPSLSLAPSLLISQISNENVLFSITSPPKISPKTVLSDVSDLLNHSLFVLPRRPQEWGSHKWDWRERNSLLGTRLASAPTWGRWQPWLLPFIILGSTEWRVLIWGLGDYLRVHDTNSFKQVIL